VSRGAVGASGALGAASVVLLVVLLAGGLGPTVPVPVTDGPPARVSSRPPGDGRDFGQRLLRVAATQLGVPYSWGGGNLTGPTLGLESGASTVGFDCSALVRFAAYRASSGTLLVPRVADAQTRVGTPVPLDRLQPGDVISFTRPGESEAHHVGIYAGLGRMIHAPLTSGRVRVESLRSTYWRSQRWRAVRYEPRPG
jgi:cell wall-associated NlpC family hydrolase